MAAMDMWDVVILVVAAYIAVLTLVRLMRRRRDAVVAQLQTEVASQLEQKRAEKRREANRASRGKSAAATARLVKR
jgi:hypothetical protein